MSDLLLGHLDTTRAVGSFAERRERLSPRLARAREHRIDRRTHEPPVSAGCGEDLDLSGVGPPTERVGVDTEDPAAVTAFLRAFLVAGLA